MAAASLPGQSHQSSTSYIEKLSDWDSPTDPLSPLTSEQKDSYLELASLAGNRALPIELPLDEPVNIRHKVSTTEIHPPGSVEDVLARGFSEMGMASEKIQDVQQFYSWFNKVEEKMSQLEAEGYTEHVDILKTYKGHCNNIIGDIDKALSSLIELEKEYIFVSTKTNALHDACEQLLADQTKLIHTAESIDHDLAFFNELDRITTKLHSPSLAVTGESFHALLTRIDECIEFLTAHSSYRDSVEYLTKFKACLSTALTMIKNYVIKSLNNTTKGILNRKVSPISSSKKTSTLGIDAENNSPVQEDAFTLYYGKFRTNAPRIIGLAEQIEKRIDLNVEYGYILSEIHRCYFSQREQLIGPSVTTAMADLLALNKQDQCALVRSGCAFMVHVCEDEHQLYGHFFTVSSQKLDEMLQRLCGNLYDMLRPLIIHVYHMETLAELCTILKTEMIDDHVQNNPEQLHAFGFVAKQMLEDVQERLVFRANIHIRDDILGYKPAPGDLAYPEKLQMMEEIAKSLKEAASKQATSQSFIEIKLDEEQESSGSNKQLNASTSVTDVRSADTSVRSGVEQNQQRFQTSPADMHGMWYPTVRRVLVCLSKLYRCIDKTIFQGLSQEALQACVQSLVRASNAIQTQEFANQGAKGSAKKTVKPKVVDSQLFLIKHLLILREQIAPFHAEFAIRETQLDFTRTKDVAYQMLEFSTIPKLLRVNSNNALLHFFTEGAPEVKEFYIDSKKDVDRQLKYVCEAFIEHVTKMLVGVLDDFMNKARLVLNVSKEEGGPKTSLRQQAFAKPEQLKEVISAAYRDLKTTAKNVHASLSLYLANRDTENILFKPIKLNVQQAYQQLEIILLENYTEDDRGIIAAPSPDQISVLLTVIRK